MLSQLQNLKLENSCSCNSCNGKGLINAFKEMGADYVVSGGQSMNPSTEDFIRGYDTLNADHIIVFPNNSNITAANQCKNI